MSYNITTIKKLFENINATISSNEFLETHRITPTAFTRERKLSFSDIMQFILKLPQKSLPREIDLYFKKHLPQKSKCSKQAFSKQRQLINASAFKELFSLTSEAAYSSKQTSLWKGHQLYAIDGTCLQLPDTVENRELYGAVSGNTNPLAMARASALYNILDDIIVDVELSTYSSSERVLAEKLIRSYSNIKGKKRPILILDRGYPSRHLIKFLIDENWFFLIRCSTSVMKPVTTAPYGDSFVRDLYKDFPFLFRVIKLKLPSGITETLVTNLYDKNYKKEEIFKLYFERWKIETKYGELKNRMLVENFSGKKPITLEQDFYAALLCSNIVAIIKKIIDYQIEKENLLKELKHRYQANRSYLIGVVIDHIVELIRTSRGRCKTIRVIIDKGKMQRSEIRPNRTSERSIKHLRANYCTSYKTNI